jgi:hypothetical protein
MRVPVLSPARLGSLKYITHASTSAVPPQFNFRAQYHILSHCPKLAPLNRLPSRSVNNVTQSLRNVSYEQKAKDLNQQGVDEALSEFDTAVAEDKEKQHRAPWHRQGVEEPPVRRQRSAGAMTKGTLLTAGAKTFC